MCGFLVALVISKWFLIRNYSINQRMLYVFFCLWSCHSADTYRICSFDENYNLASTQSLKNKDIPEGGAKGTILPSSVFSYSAA